MLTESEKMMAKPLGFKPEMFKAATANPPLKTMTRRLISLPKWSTQDWADFELDDDGTPLIICADTGCLAAIPQPFKTGEIRYLTEPTQLIDSRSCDYAIVRYDDGMTTKIRPTVFDWERLLARKDMSARAIGRFMLRSFARYWVQVESLKAERLQDISEADAIREGIFQLEDGGWSGRFDRKQGMYKSMPTPIDGFRDLWESIHGEDSWSLNPWLWAVGFHKITAHA